MAKKKPEADENPQLEADVLHGLLAHPGHFIRRLHQISVAIFLKETEDAGLTQVQYATLLTIAYAPGLDQAMLGRLVALDRQTISTVVRRLVDKGYVRREAKDGRTNALYVTRKSAQIMDQMRDKANGVGDIVLAPLTSSERATFMKLLMKVVETNNNLSRAPYQSNQ